MTTKNPTKHDIATTPTAQSLSLVIDKVLRCDAELEAFCIDHFPRVKIRFSDGMERRIKVTLLLAQEDRRDVLAALKENAPHIVENYDHLLVYEHIPEGAIDLNSTEDITQPLPSGCLSRLESFGETHPMMFHYIWMIIVCLLVWIGVPLLVHHCNK